MRQKTASWPAMASLGLLLAAMGVSSLSFFGDCSKNGLSNQQPPRNQFAEGVGLTKTKMLALVTTPSAFEPFLVVSSLSFFGFKAWMGFPTRPIL